MTGDFSRFTFDPAKHYNRVRLQQGRVQLDSDWNEQADLINHRLDNLTHDLIGVDGVPRTRDGFAITITDDSPADLIIGAGHYFVEGVLCENEQPIAFAAQPHLPAAQLPTDPGLYLIYLDVWEREITAAQDPSIREVALGGPDTATRTQIVWQVKWLPISDDPSHASHRVDHTWESFIAAHGNPGSLRARYAINDESDEALPLPTSLLDNQLYRVEIHQGGSEGGDSTRATFKWSRENGSIALPISAIETLTHTDALGNVTTQLRLTLEELAADPYQLQPGNWVEIADDNAVLTADPWNTLYAVANVDGPRGQVILNGALPDGVQHAIPDLIARHAVLRRWDHKANGGLIAIAPDQWIDLENGVQIAFAPDSSYHPGDYWLIPARASAGESLGGIEWPTNPHGPIARPPNGIQHHYSRLALLLGEANGWSITQDYRKLFDSLPVLTIDLARTSSQISQLEATVRQLRGTVSALLDEVRTLQKEKEVTRHQVIDEFSSEESLEVGDVVALDHAHGHRVLRVTKDNPTYVVGVVAGFPPATEHKSDKLVRVVLYGQARCKVIGRVRPGDLLVVSDVEGCAHVAGVYIRPGTVIGKALGSHESTEPGKHGIIEVLVTLN